MNRHTVNPEFSTPKSIKILASAIDIIDKVPYFSPFPINLSGKWCIQITFKPLDMLWKRTQ
jgi:hypothetical protein